MGTALGMLLLTLTLNLSFAQPSEETEIAGYLRNLGSVRGVTREIAHQTILSFSLTRPDFFYRLTSLAIVDPDFEVQRRGRALRQSGHQLNIGAASRNMPEFLRLFSYYSNLNGEGYPIHNHWRLRDSIPLPGGIQASVVLDLQSEGTYRLIYREYFQGRFETVLLEDQWWWSQGRMVFPGVATVEVAPVSRAFRLRLNRNLRTAGLNGNSGILVKAFSVWLPP